MSVNIRNDKLYEAPTEKLKVPFLILTQKLIIRPLIYEDRSALQTAIRDSLSDIRMWLPWDDHTPKADEYMMIANKLFEENNANSIVHFSVYYNETLLGMCSYQNIDMQNKTCRIGFWSRVMPSCDIYIVDALNAVLRYGFEVGGFKTLYIPCVVGNYIHELAAKQLNFKLQSVDIVGNKQMKTFVIDDISQLPDIQMQIVQSNS